MNFLERDDNGKKRSEITVEECVNYDRIMGFLPTHVLSFKYYDHEPHQLFMRTVRVYVNNKINVVSGDKVIIWVDKISNGQNPGGKVATYDGKKWIIDDLTLSSKEKGELNSDISAITVFLMEEF